MQVEFVTIEKNELIRLIDCTVKEAIADALKPTDEVLSKREAASYLKCSAATLTRRMKEGLPHSGNGNPKFRRSELDKWLTAR